MNHFNVHYHNNNGTNDNNNYTYANDSKIILHRQFDSKG